ncbi:response regulator transcription factor [Cohnella cholangitidis]|uniref:Response regulator n=1 Tax=Cohnella cholangitidis TaxID=2598458 RepID=A0A7G5C4Z4_9BACL|nr:response regulator [Cohnella cholangitidis]QMV44278.1 response regulator [Cohnella cholangitidis]
MIRAVVVDDEKLVRKGFISLIDWARFGIVMVGEAADGRSALELLERTEVDLLFTDITMPVMSGFDLIKQVRQKFPKVKSVVLTCHHEFDFVQEALRLGAIDYIVKTLLEMDNADDVVMRIVERFEWEEGNRAALMTDVNPKRLSAHSAILFLPLSPELDNSQLFQMGIVRRNPLERLDRMWMAQLVHPPTLEELNRDLGRELLSRWQIAIVSGLDNRLIEEVRRTLEDRLPQTLFYKAAKGELTRLRYDELACAEPSGLKPAEAWIDEGLEMKWTLSATSWDSFIGRVLKQMPLAEEILRFGESLCRDWSGLLVKPSDATTLQTDMKGNLNWSDWQSWLKRYSDLIQLRMIELSLSKEVMLCLIRAIRFMKEHAGEKINQADVAGYVSMSRGYFSQCFAKLAGETFGEVLRNMRIDKAKAMLVESTSPIYEVASMAGFEDDKYFSKLFRERVGKLPTEYRLDGGKEVYP